MSIIALSIARSREGGMPTRGGVHGRMIPCVPERRMGRERERESSWERRQQQAQQLRVEPMAR